MKTISYKFSQHIFRSISLVILIVIISVGSEIAGIGSIQVVKAATLNVDNSGFCDDGTIGPYCTVEDAVGDAVGGDVINIAAGTYTQATQVVIDKNLTIVGAGETQTTLLPGFTTGNSGAARGWFHVTTGNTLDLSDLTMDGNYPTREVYQAIRHQGNGTIQRVTFQNIQYEPSGPRYQGVAVAAFGGNVDISDSTFTNIGRNGVLYFGTGITGSTYENNTYVGKGSGDFLDYALDISNGAVADVINSSVSGNRGVASSDGSRSAGYLTSTFFGPGTVGTFTGNNIFDNTMGIAGGVCLLEVPFEIIIDPDPCTNPIDTSTVTANFNRIFGNEDGIDIAYSNITLNVNNNWWGCNTGPDTTGCDTMDFQAPQTIADFGGIPTWLVLSPLPPGTPTCVPPNSSTTTNSVTVILNNLNSDPSTGATEHIPDDLPVAFTTSTGSVNSPIGTLDGVAETTLTAPGGFNVTGTATLDNQTIDTDTVDTSICSEPSDDDDNDNDDDDDESSPDISIFDPAISKVGVLQPGQVGLVGEKIEWIITVTNNGNAIGNNIIIVDNIIPALQIDGVSSNVNSISTINGQTVTVTLPTLDPGQSVTYSIFTTVLVSDITVNNTACLSSDNDNNEVCTTTQADTRLAGVAQLPSTGESPFWRRWLWLLALPLLLIPISQRKRIL